MQICAIVNFRVIHIFSKGNSCIDRLTNLGVKNRIEFAKYSTLLDGIRLGFFHNMFQLPFFVCRKFVLFFLQEFGMVSYAFCYFFFLFFLIIFFHMMIDDL